ncbi:MAG TPA: MFS transporter [Candidatus Polarisedimenticolia bacterium]|nr:MFS transporter [Candidatus Polarisedimenticolia bacterium]
MAESVSRLPADSGDRGASYAIYVLTLLTCLNLLDYLDRYVIASVQSLVRKDFPLTDADYGLFGTLFFLVYLTTAPIFGYLGDRYPRRRILALGAALWSLATAGSAFARSYGGLLFSRGLVGIGEASFGTLSPPFLADYFPVGKRGRVMAIFFLTIPAGAALAYLLVPLLGADRGWRFYFLLAGLPGLVLAIPILFLREPQRGAMDLPGRSTPSPGPPILAESFSYRDRVTHVIFSYRELIRARSYLFTNLGYAALTFAIGGMAFWMPRYLETIKKISLEESNRLTGGIVAVAGLLGTLAGGFAGDLLMRRTRRAYMLFSGLGVLVAIPFAWIAIVSPDRWTFSLCFAVAIFLLFLNTGPLNAVIISVSPVPLRSTAVAANIVIIHILGDAPSPYLIGWVSDHSSLQHGILLAVAAMSISGVLLLIGSRHLPGDLDRAAGRPASSSRQSSW